MRFSRYIVGKIIFILPNGDGEIRTLDPLLARQVLSQLSYTPISSGDHLLSHTVSSAVSSAAYGLTVVFGMGTGVSRKRITTGQLLSLNNSTVKHTLYFRSTSYRSANLSLRFTARLR